VLKLKPVYIILISFDHSCDWLLITPVCKVRGDMCQLSGIPIQLATGSA